MEKCTICGRVDANHLQDLRHVYRNVAREARATHCDYLSPFLFYKHEHNSVECFYADIDLETGQLGEWKYWGCYPPERAIVL